MKKIVILSSSPIYVAFDGMLKGFVTLADTITGILTPVTGALMK